MQHYVIKFVSDLRQFGGVLYTTVCDKVCQWLATGRWFSLCTPVSSTNKTDHHEITEILLKVALNTIIQTNQIKNNYVISIDLRHWVKISKICFSAKHAAIRRKSKDCLAWNQDTVSEWVTGLESRYCVRVGDRLGIKILCRSGWHVYLQTVVSVS